MIEYIIIFLISSIAIAIAGKWTVDALSRIAYFSHWKEFVVAFFTISLGAVAPEFFIGIFSALHGVPELSLGNVVGQNIILLTLTVALTVFALKGSLNIESKTVKTSGIFAAIAAILPLVLVWDGYLSRGDGLILIASFVFFIVWLFKKEDRFTKIYQGVKVPPPKRKLVSALKDIGIVIFGLAIIVLSAEGLIKSALAFADDFGIAVSVVGILILAAGTGFPETYFSIKLALRNYSWMILGGLMGSVVISSTLVLGMVAIIHPIEITDFSVLAVSRFFLIVSALFFLFFMRTKNRITTKEAWILLFIYFSFLVSLFVF